MQDCLTLFVLPFVMLPLCWNSHSQCHAFRLEIAAVHRPSSDEPSVYSSTPHKVKAALSSGTRPQSQGAAASPTETADASSTTRLGAKLRLIESKLSALLPAQEMEADEDAADDALLDPLSKRDFSRDRKWYHFSKEEYQRMRNFFNRQRTGRRKYVLSRPRMVG